MSYKSGYANYKKVDVNTASQGKLVVMLYEGAIRFCEEAIGHIKAGTKELEEAHRKIVKAQDVVTELYASLNYDAGDIATRLASIYNYINRRLLDANVKKDAAPINEVLKYLRELKEAWGQAAESGSGAQPTQSAKSGLNLNVNSVSSSKDSSSSGGRVNIAG